MLTIACVKVGDRYPAEYVNILHDSVRRNLSKEVEGRFVCLTDDPTGLDEGIEVVRMPTDLQGWWAKLYLFAPNVFSENERVLYFDLDMVIVGALDEIASYAGKFAILSDAYRPGGLQSSCMAFPGGTMGYVWQFWNADGRPRLPGGDQEWIERMVPNPTLLQDEYPGAFLSYKVDMAGRRTLPRGARVVDFHGRPKPDEVDADWVKQIWRKGGGTSADIELVCNTDMSEVLRNVEINSHRTIPWLEMRPAHKGSAVIVGGGPSVKSLLDDITKRQKDGARVYALNGAGHMLADAGIVGFNQVIMDARPENVGMFSYYAMWWEFASQCSPPLFDMAGTSNRISLWHAHTDGLDEVLEQFEGNGKPRCYVAGGSTVLLSAMCIAYAHGSREIHVYGGDSSFTDNHHAYPQTLNDDDEVIDAVCEGRQFKTTPWMVAQAQQFQIVAADLANAGAEIIVHGDGLLPHVARNMGAQATDDGMKMVSGIWWPDFDNHAAHIMDSVNSLNSVLSRVEGRLVAVQAGGNVGVWPLHLAHRFKEVFTFEPDDLNYKCLVRNCGGKENIHAFNAALGDAHGSVSMARIPGNAGASFIRAGRDVQVVRIDDLALEHCDFIALDVEGYELSALKGAERTIRKFRPTILIEDKGLSERYGVAQGEATEWLGALGYSVCAKLDRDIILQAA